MDAIVDDPVLSSSGLQQLAVTGVGRLLACDTLTKWRVSLDAFAPVIARAQQLATLIDRLGAAFDDLAELTATAHRISGQLDELSAAAEGLNQSADIISRDAVVIAAALPNVERLATFVDRLPGSRRRVRPALIDLDVDGRRGS